MKYRAYLDIETTGLSPHNGDLTVIGLHIEDGSDEVIQFVGKEISSSKLVEALRDADRVYTYNGKKFDLPFIKDKLMVDVTDYCEHEDLMYACWKRNLYGGLKAVERRLGIRRELADVDGWMAVQLWHEYRRNGNERALSTLLAYNREDVLNLKVLRGMLTDR